jgi:hypothetical protein
MRKSLLFVIAIALVMDVLASDWLGINANQPAEPKIELLSSDVSKSTIRLSLDGFNRSIVQTPRGEAWFLSVENSGFLLEQGAPQLPLLAASVIIPDKAGTKIEVVSSDYVEYQGVLVAPSKGNLTRDIDPSSQKYVFGEAYSTDAVFPGEIAELSEPYILRDHRGQAVRFMPFQYNPVTQVLRVYHSITIQVTEDGLSDVNVLNRKSEFEVVSKPFQQVYNSHFLNHEPAGSRYSPVEEEGNMIVISHGDFMDEMEPFVEWKKMKGMPCSLVDIATIGSTSEDIKEFIETAYEFSGVTFVLLVGDAAQVPSSVISGNDSDVDYSYVAGNDHYPDLFVGRFSAQTEAQVITQVNRTLEYEQNPISDTAWYRKAIGIASSEGPGDDNEMDYQHIRNIQDNKLIPYTYNWGYEFFEGSQGNNDDPGNPSAAAVATCVNSGATIINYTGHGSTSAWSTSGFNNGNVNSLTNTGNWPFIISVACVNGNFVNATCFAEAWLRAEDNGDPTGAIATLMSTINQSWNPPMCGQDEMNDILTEAFSNNIKRTFGGITMNGCMGMNDTYGSNGYEMTDTWTIFGDPSVVVRTDIPSEMTVSHPDSLDLDATSLTITSDAEGGIAALTLDGVIIGTAEVVDGEAIITFIPLQDMGTADIVVTAYNYRPYISTIEIVGVLGPMVVYADSEINDELGNDDGLLDYAEEILLTVDLENVGIEDAFNVTGQLSSNNPFVEIIVSDTLYGTIAAGETVTIPDGFRFAVSNDIPDGEVIEFNISASDESSRGVWESSFELTAHAPVFEFTAFEINDENGNGNGLLDAGETAEIVVDITNSGSSAAYNLVSQLVSENEYVNVLTDEIMLGDIQAGGDMVQAVFEVTAEGDTPPGYLAEFLIQLIATHDLSLEEPFMAIVGKMPALVIDFTGSSSSADSIVSAMNVLSIQPELETQIPEYPDRYQSIFVLLGVYPDNHVLTESEGASLSNFLENGGRVYMEGADTWFNDDPSPVHPMFHIKGEEDGSNDVSSILGEKDTFLEGLEFTFSGTNNFIDRISPMEEAVLLMSNTDPIYGVMVGYENETYKTIGSSVPFGGLVDQFGSTKDEMMSEVLDFFEIGFVWTSLPENAIVDSEVTAFPNPFVHDVTIGVTLKEDIHVKLEIYDLTGRLISTLYDGQMDQGLHRLNWDAARDKADPGIYLYSLIAGNQKITRKLIMN